MSTLAKEEMQRIDALEQYELLGSGADPALDEITALAAQICGTPMAGLSLIHLDSVYFQSRFGPGPVRAERGTMPCEACVQGEGIYEITDARYHPDYRPTGIILAGRAFRFYAGAPLVTPGGVALGCLFVQHSLPHKLTEQEKQALVTLSRQVITRLELNRSTRQMERDRRVRQRVESALTVERNFVSTVLDTVGALVAVYDTAGRIVRFNRTCEAVSGYDFSSLVGHFVWEKLIPQEDIPAAIDAFERLRNGNFPTSFENYWRHRDGSLRRIAWSATGLIDAHGQTTFIIATGIDVTLQRGAEATLRESEARYRQLVEGSLGTVCTHDVSGTVLSINKHGAESFGRSVGEVVGRPLTSFVPPEMRGEVKLYLKKIVETGEAQGRLHLLQREGKISVVAFRNKLIEPPNGVKYILGFGVDITEQVRAEESLRALIHQSNSILESVGDGIYGVDLAGRVTFINPAAAEMLGYKAHELLGQKLHPLIHHTRADGSFYPAQDCAVGSTVSNRGSVRILNEVFWRKDGTSFSVEYVARPQIDSFEGSPRAKPIGVVVAFTDTTERRALDRMKDEFISTVAHELRTPLTSMRASLGLVSGGALAARPEKMQQMLEIAIGNTDRLIRLVNDFLDIERIASGNADLHSSLSSAKMLLERAATLQQAPALKKALSLKIEANDFEVWCDPERIVQALDHFISNAIKFSPEGGTIALTARAVDEHEAEFQVSDQGPGVPESQVQKIFERFQQGDASDSREKGGTGLGLAICRSIVVQHGGRIWVTSVPGEGAKFHFTVPTHASEHLR